MQFRQGDVWIEKIDTVPNSAVDVPLENGRIVLAHGEVTGHAHAIKSRRAKLRQSGGERYLSVSSPVSLSHEEHATIAIPPGNYRVQIQKEYSPEAIRNVAD